MVVVTGTSTWGRAGHPILNILSKLLGRNARGETIATNSAPAHDARGIAPGIADTIDRALSSAGLHRDAGPGTRIRATIDDALAKAGLGPTEVVAGDGVLRAVVVPPRDDDAATTTDSATPNATAGDFVQRRFANAAGSRDYKLYIPVGYSDSAHATGTHATAPLVIMLHGCTQSPDDFAAGTRMNALADAHGFLVAYPAQTARANGSKCWNWFRTEDQQADSGEPSIIAGIARQVASDYRIDPTRIFVAGLSAGAAMAVILGETHPDVFAAVGAHSGLPYAAAHDMPSAFAAMQGRGARNQSGEKHSVPPPTIVFHGDRDHTVALDNGGAITAAATVGLIASSHPGITSGGHAYTRDVFVDAHGQSRAEQWTVHGAGHAWSGGSAQGTYTDPAGPDASAEMIRFFLQQRDVAG
jgi:poly(hydroxyalkanoate) depolymerase family esterase